DRNRRLRRAGERDRLLRVGGGRDEVEPGLGPDERRKGVADGRIVLGDEDRDRRRLAHATSTRPAGGAGRHTSTAARCPGSDATRSQPPARSTRSRIEARPAWAGTGAACAGTTPLPSSATRAR